MMKPNNPIFEYIVRHDMCDELLNYCVYMYRASRLSLFNSATLLVQRSGIGFATSEKTWLKHYGRYLKPEANPLIIMKPFAPLELFYEACDTYDMENQALPEWMTETSIVTTSTTPFTLSYQDVLPVLQAHGIYYAEAEMGARMGGLMDFRETPVWIRIPRKKKIVEYQTHYAMVVNSKSNDTSKAESIFHEIGHLLCGHLPEDETLKNNSEIRLNIPKRDRTHLTEVTQEYEAEMTCEFILKAMGFDYDSNAYLKQYEDGEVPEFDLGIVITAADQFLSWF